MTQEHGPLVSEAHTAGMIADKAPLGLYIHWPFCKAKCPYCDFNSHVSGGPVEQKRWRNALITELHTLAARAPDHRLHSIFFGGGTPSLMPPETVAALIEQARQIWACSGAIEITLEANPTSTGAGRFAAFRAAGINRLSLGIQALNDPDLKRLGRRHSASEALAALAMGRAIFPRVSFDLIYGRSGQGLEAWQAELEQALGLGTEHISLYQLTIEENTPYFRAAREGRLNLPEDDLAAAFFNRTHVMCREAGLPGYEVSNFARPGCESRHNLVYWRTLDYLGIGPGAHSRLAGRALAMRRAPHDWLEQVEERGHGLDEDIRLTPRERAEEFILMGLRLKTGIDLDNLYRRTGARLDEHATVPLQEEGLLHCDGARLRIAGRGRLVLNAVIAELSQALQIDNEQSGDCHGTDLH